MALKHRSTKVACHPVAVEVSPLFGYDEDSFADSWRKLAKKPAISEGLYLE